MRVQITTRKAFGSPLATPCRNTPGGGLGRIGHREGDGGCRDAGCKSEPQCLAAGDLGASQLVPIHDVFAHDTPLLPIEPHITALNNGLMTPGRSGAVSGGQALWEL